MLSWQLVVLQILVYAVIDNIFHYLPMEKDVTTQSIKLMNPPKML